MDLKRVDGDIRRIRVARHFPDPVADDFHGDGAAAEQFAGDDTFQHHPVEIDDIGPPREAPQQQNGLRQAPGPAGGPGDPDDGKRVTGIVMVGPLAAGDDRDDLERGGQRGGDRRHVGRGPAMVGRKDAGDDQEPRPLRRAGHRDTPDRPISVSHC